VRASVLLSAFFLSSAVASAQAPLLTGLGGELGYGTSCLHRNDDGSSPRIDLTPAFPAGLRFFDMTHTSVFVNTNGNLTFSRALSTFTPRAFPVAAQPMIAPFWADIDTRTYAGEGVFGRDCTSESSGTCSGGNNSIWWHLEEGRMIVTWFETAYFACWETVPERMTFQLILTAVPSCGGGATDFDVEFRYNECEWETGDASGGRNGFGGTPAQAGFDAGNERDFVAIMGSRTAGIADRLCTMSNVGEPGVWRFQIRSGTVLCPEAGEACDTEQQGVCAEGVTQCVGMGTSCEPIVPASDERCDALDNDCDGNTDEGEGICGSATAVCDRGTCVDVCFEGGCPEGLVCSEEGRCIEPGCDEVECPPGQRCRGGECVDACDGVTCPAGQDCRAGRCLDLCADLSCDPECSVCSAGECVPRCNLPGNSCDAGQLCNAEGLCVPTECSGVTCEAGSTCVAGRGCVDACEGAVCPTGETCMTGECVPNMSIVPDSDAGMMEETDAGGEVEEPDAGPVDAGRIPPRRGDDGCGCVAAGAGSSAPVLPLALSALGFALVVARRRRR